MEPPEAKSSVRKSLIPVSRFYQKQVRGTVYIQSWGPLYKVTKTRRWRSLGPLYLPADGVITSLHFCIYKHHWKRANCCILLILAEHRGRVLIPSYVQRKLYGGGYIWASKVWELKGCSHKGLFMTPGVHMTLGWVSHTSQLSGCFMTSMTLRDTETSKCTLTNTKILLSCTTPQIRVGSTA